MFKQVPLIPNYAQAKIFYTTTFYTTITFYNRNYKIHNIN